MQARSSGDDSPVRRHKRHAPGPIHFWCSPRSPRAPRQSREKATCETSRTGCIVPQPRFRPFHKTPLSKSLKNPFFKPSLLHEEELQSRSCPARSRKDSEELSQPQWRLYLVNRGRAARRPMVHRIHSAAKANCSSHNHLVPSENMQE